MATNLSLDLSAIHERTLGVPPDEDYVVTHRSTDSGEEAILLQNRQNYHNSCQVLTESPMAKKAIVQVMILYS